MRKKGSGIGYQGSERRDEVWGMRKKGAGIRYQGSERQDEG